ncbi:unnamed protein product, partial [Mesorhabditis belari]|uniref:Uncharacterized protein n=1 Tax=Mesorhabditis belari TaxID=2138241 RepID=A0AAF3JBY3_9BILA
MRPLISIFISLLVIGVCMAFIPVTLTNSAEKDPNAAPFPLCNPFCPGGAVYVCCVRYLHVLGGYCNGSAAWCY